MEDRRLKVRHKDGRIGAVEKIISKKYCSVQFHRDGYYVLCLIDDLEPIEEELFKRKFR